MTYAEAIAATREVMKDSRIQDEGLALNSALRTINSIASGSTSAHPLLVVDAFAIASALYRGEEGK